MDTVDLIYSELKLVKKELSEIRKDLVNFKMKVIMYAVFVSAGTGIGLPKILSLLT